MVPREHTRRLTPGGNGVFRPTVVAGGQVVGTWRPVRARGAQPAGLEVEPSAPPAVGVAAQAARVHRRWP